MKEFAVPFLLFSSLEPCGHVMRVWGEEKKKRRWMYGCMGVFEYQDVWVFRYH